MNLFALAGSWILVLLCISPCSSQGPKTVGKVKESKSFYPLKLEDEDATYFTSDRFQITNDGKTDVSDELQRAINEVKTNFNFGIVFIPEGTYKISRTIYIPTAVRVIGYGKKRPVFILADHSPGFDQAYPDDKGKAKYMFWFTSSVLKPGEPVPDAGASTFYSAMSNIDLRIGNGNPSAVALRTHFAQHSFISHVDIYAGNGKAGMFDVGNEMEDVRFFGGEYGIYTFKPSPGWQFMMVDTYFEGQRKAAIQSREAGLTIVRMSVRNVPSVLEVSPDCYEKLFIEDSRLENISGPAFLISNAGNAYTQISLRNIDCSNVPLLMQFRDTERKVTGAGPIYKVKTFNHGLQMTSIVAEPVHQTTSEIVASKIFPEPVKKDIPDFPDAKKWVNLKALGARGDGITDDTKAIQDAIDKHDAIYVPQGWYRVTETIRMKPKTALIGLNPVATQFVLAENTEAFGSFGSPKPVVESGVGGANIFSGIGISTGASNSRAVGLKWVAGADSYVNDVKFLGGHGNISRKKAGGEMQNASHSGNEKLWDSQYWSLWVAENGGGTFKNIWSANTFAASGAYFSNTSTHGRIYAMSVEHHVRNEVTFKNVSNWKVYALQLEEESLESSECQPIEIESCQDIVFANLYMFRVIRVRTPYPYAIRSWLNKNIEFLNVHNYSQTKYSATVPLYDINLDKEVRPWEFQRLFLGKNNWKIMPPESYKGIMKLFQGFQFADGICRDSEGSVYFCESRMKRIYKISARGDRISLVADFPWEPLSLGFDTKDHLLVVFKYVPKPGYLKNGQPEVFPNPPDAAGTSFSGWGNNGFGTMVYAMNPNNPEETLYLLPKVPLDSVQQIVKTLNPSNRRRDSGDFKKVSTNHFTECWLAPDGVTIVPVVYDLARSNALVEGFPGKPFYGTDEYLKRTFKFAVGEKGYLAEPQLFAERGEFSSATDDNGNVYIADGQIYVYDKTGKETGMIGVPDRPVSIVIAGENNETLFITTRGAVYCVKIK